MFLVHVGAPEDRSEQSKRSEPLGLESSLLRRRVTRLTRELAVSSTDNLLRRRFRVNGGSSLNLLLAMFSLASASKKDSSEFEAILESAVLLLPTLVFSSVFFLVFSGYSLARWMHTLGKYCCGQGCKFAHDFRLKRERSEIFAFA